MSRAHELAAALRLAITATVTARREWDRSGGEMFGPAHDAYVAAWADQERAIDALRDHARDGEDAQTRLDSLTEDLAEPDLPAEAVAESWGIQRAASAA